MSIKDGGPSFTPGPWTFESGDNYYISSPLLPREFPHKFKSDSTGDFVAYIGNHTPDFGEANARLISSAPDMYEALKDLLDDVCDREDVDSPSCNPGRQSAVKWARAALAKAGGQ